MQKVAVKEHLLRENPLEVEIMLFYYISDYWNCLVDTYWFRKESVSVTYGESI